MNHQVRGLLLFVRKPPDQDSFFQDVTEVVQILQKCFKVSGPPDRLNLHSAYKLQTLSLRRKKSQRLTPGPRWVVCLVLVGSTGTGVGCWWGRHSARQSVRPASSRCRWSPLAPPPRAPGRSQPGPSPTPPLGPPKMKKRRRASRRSWWRSCHPRPGASRALQGRDLPLQSSPPAGDISPLSCRLSALHCKERETERERESGWENPLKVTCWGIWTSLRFMHSKQQEQNLKTRHLSGSRFDSNWEIFNV